MMHLQKVKSETLKILSSQHGGTKRIRKWETEKSQKSFHLSKQNSDLLQQGHISEM